MIAETEDNRSFSLFALNIVKAKGRMIFSKNSALNCLSRSDSFFGELSNLFSNLFYGDITPQKFLETVLGLETSRVDKERLELCAKLYGSYVEIMESNAYKIPPSKVLQKMSGGAEHPEIQKRLDFLKAHFEAGKKPAFLLEKSECVCYLEFSDIQNESVYIIEEIKKLVDSGQYSYADFAVFVDKTEARQKFSDLMKTGNLPVISSIYNEDYENLKHKIFVYQKISEVCLRLKLESFSSEDFKNINLDSKAEKEICLEELDEILKGLMGEVLADGYVLDKILSAKENSSKTFLETVYSSWNKFAESDKELVIQEFGAIKNFYESYKNFEFAKAIESLLKRYFAVFENTQVKDVAAGKIKSLNELQKLYSLLGDKPDFDSFKEIMEWLPPDKTKGKNAVNLASINANLSEKQKYKFIYIAGLSENNFPGANPSYPFISLQSNELLVCALKKINPKFECFLKTDEMYFAQRFSAFCSLMTKAQEKISFSTHTYEAKKQALPSAFFKALSANDIANFWVVEDKTEPVLQDNEKIAEFEKSLQRKVVSDEDVLRLNPSAVSVFLTCPRKYYYKNLLNLKETSTFSASYGSIVHAVFEVLNRRFLDSYNKDTALALAEVLFDAKNDEEKVLKAGFKQNDAELVKAADDLSLAEMWDNFKDAVEDFSMSGYFDNPPETAVCEKGFTFKLEEFPNVVFDGRIDAICGGEKMRVIDYKTGKDKVKSLDEAMENFDKSQEFQIPMYYFACQKSDDLAEFKDKISQLGFVYVRPTSKHGGCDEDFVSAERVEENKEKILQNLKETVVDKIVNETEFKKTQGWGCDNCSFKFLCDKDSGEGGEDEQ